MITVKYKKQIGKTEGVLSVREDLYSECPVFITLNADFEDGDYVEVGRSIATTGISVLLYQIQKQLVRQ